MLWPPVGVSPFNPFEIPLLNTSVLLSRGVTVTISHIGLLENNLSLSRSRLWLTSLLGLFFSVLQAIEYVEAPFSISDSVFGSLFFIATGFHGLHVLIGTIFLVLIAVRMDVFHFSSTKHTGFELAAWY